MSQTMKLWKRVIEHRLEVCKSTSNNQLIRQMMYFYRARKDIHMIFIDLEKAYDKVPRDVLWRAMLKKGIPQPCIGMSRKSKDLGLPKDFLITIRLH